MRSKISFLLTLVLILGLVSGCDPVTQTTTQIPPTSTPASTSPISTAPPEPKVITIGFGYDASSLDVHKLNDDGSYTLLNLLGEGLTRYDDGFISPGVAESWDVSDDSMSYVFHLRSDAKWSDGSPLTAYDFEYSFRRLIDPELGLRNASGAILTFRNAQEYYDGNVSIEEVGIKALDERTLEIVLQDPSLTTLSGFAGYARFPVSKAKVDEYGDAYGSEANTILTNGPFMLSEWRHEDQQILVKNDNYWNKEAIKLDGIIRRVGVSATTAQDMMMVGELNAYSLTNQNIVNSLVSEGFQPITYVSGYQFVHMNSGGSSAALKPFMSNSNFRRALNYAVNREALTLSVYTGAEPVYRITSPGVAGVSKPFNEEYPYRAWPVAGDPDKAKECLLLALQEIGAIHDDIPELSMLVSDSESSILVMQAVQDMLLSVLGIKAKIDPQPVQQMLEKANNGDWDLWWGGKSLGTLDWFGSFAIDFDDSYISQINNYYHEGYSELYHRTRVATTMKERKDLLFELEKILCEDPGSILVGWRQSWTVLTPDVSGVLIVDGSTNYTFADINH